MSQIIVRPGRNAAREAKRIKEVRKVKAAIKWHLNDRKKKLEGRKTLGESKNAMQQLINYEKTNIKDVRKRALNNAKEDWALGRLRPNRSGEDAATYGALHSDQVNRPPVPIDLHNYQNQVREKKGLLPRYPLIVDGERYFPYAKGDRVLLLTGRDKGKIGVVQDILRRTHQIIVEGLNKQNYDTQVFGAATRESRGPVMDHEVPVGLEDVRLVVPYQIIRNGVMVGKDVVVERVDMKRHTTGIDPFTLKDYGDATIPEEHQCDPETGLPIFHRYVAGTDQRIAWPWELEKEPTSELEDQSKQEMSQPKKSFISRALNTLRHPIKSFQGSASATSENARGIPASEVETFQQRKERLEREEEEMRTRPPRSEKLELGGAYDEDTTRNIVEGAQAMVYTLISPPFPQDLSDELDLHESSSQTQKNSRDGESTKQRARKIKPRGAAQSPILKEVAARKLAAESMKTPTQLLWEVERAKKQKKKPLVTEQALLVALGRHMQGNMVKPTSKSHTI